MFHVASLSAFRRINSVIYQIVEVPSDFPCNFVKFLMIEVFAFRIHESRQTHRSQIAHLFGFR